MLACVLAFEPGAETVLQRLILPLVMATAAALVLRNLLAVLATGALLSAIQTDWQHAPGPGPTTLGWIDATAYPIIGVLCAVATTIILLRRFQRHIQSTAAARAAKRQKD